MRCVFVITHMLGDNTVIFVLLQYATNRLQLLRVS